MGLFNLKSRRMLKVTYGVWEWSIAIILHLPCESILNTIALLNVTLYFSIILFWKKTKHNIKKLTVSLVFLKSLSIWASETSLSCFFLSCNVGKRCLIHSLNPHYLQEARMRTFAFVSLIIAPGKRQGGCQKLKGSAFLWAVLSEALL